MDVYENRGKTTGAYSWGVHGVHPFVLLNYSENLDSAFTIAHELGHSLHSYYSSAAQDYVNAQYPILLAEVASTVNENLLLDSMLDDPSWSREQRIYLLSFLLEQFRTTVFRQVMFAEFERIIHARGRGGGTPGRGDLRADISGAQPPVLRRKRGDRPPHRHGVGPHFPFL